MNGLDGPSAVLIAAQLALSTETTEKNLSDPSFWDKDMVDLVRILCMAPNKPRDPTNGKIIHHQHCLLAASLLNLYAVCVYLLNEDGGSNLRETLAKPGVKRTEDNLSSEDDLSSEDNENENILPMELLRCYVELDSFCGLQNPLQFALAQKDGKLTDLFLDKFGTNTMDDLGRTPLYIACKLMYTSAALRLLERKDIDVHTQNFMCPDYVLHRAIETGNVELATAIIQKYREHQYDFNTVNEQEETFFYLACAYGIDEIVQLLIAVPSVNMSRPNFKGDKPWNLACERCHRIETLQLFMQNKHRFNIHSTNGSGNCVLHNVCFWEKDDEFIHLLCQEKSLLRIRNYTGKTPFAYGISRGKKCALELLKYTDDFDINCQDIYGNTALHLACEIFEKVIGPICDIANVDRNVRNQNQRTPLIFAAIGGSLTAIEILLQYPDVDIHAQDIDGNNALHWACIAHHSSIVQRLLDSGIDPSVRNLFNQSCYDIARQDHRWSILDILNEAKGRKK